MTVKEYFKILKKLIDENPECKEYTVIYSSDDEGNNYSKVYFGPTLCKIENLKENDNFLEINSDLKNYNAVIIN